MVNIKMLIAAHKECPLPQNDIFTPIQVGRKDAPTKLNMQGDDEGVNISGKNSQYCELTAIYWAWKNLKDYDFIGLCHYRRYPTFKKMLFKNVVERKLKYNYTKFIRNSLIPGINYTYWDSIEIPYTDEIEKIFSNLSSQIENYSNEFEIFSLKPIKLSNLSIEVYWSMTISNHVMNILESTIHEENPIIFESYVKLIKGNKIHPCNIFIFNKIIFNEYSHFLFNILSQVEQSLNKLNITPLPRTMGYIGELLTSTFIMHKNISGMKIKYFNLLNME